MSKVNNLWLQELEDLFWKVMTFQDFSQEMKKLGFCEQKIEEHWQERDPKVCLDK